MAKTGKIDRPISSNSARMKRLAEIQAQISPVSSMADMLHMLAWGRVKSGKTRLIASGPRPIIFATERGTDTIRTYPNVDVFPVERETGKYIVPRWKHARDFIYFLNHADHDYKTVGVDTMTALLRIAVRFINKDEEIRDDFRAKGTTDQRTWGRVGSIMNEFMEDLEAVCIQRGMHLIYTAQERSLGEEQAIRAGSDYVPDLTPAVRSTILEKPSILARTMIEEDASGDLNKTGLKYGMVFKHPEWPVGVREPDPKKPFPDTAFNVTIPKLLKRIQYTRSE